MMYMSALWEGTRMLLPLSYLWMNILAHSSKARCKCLDWQCGQRDRGETQSKRRPSWNAKLHTTVFLAISILGHSEILIYLFHSVSHFPFMRSGAFFVSLCVMECTHCSPVEIKLHEMSIWNKKRKKAIQSPAQARREGKSERWWWVRQGEEIGRREKSSVGRKILRCLLMGKDKKVSRKTWDWAAKQILFVPQAKQPSWKRSITFLHIFRFGRLEEPSADTL